LEVAEAVGAFVAAALVGLPDEYIFAAPGSVLGCDPEIMGGVIYTSCGR